jgi:hypothetical protein
LVIASAASSKRLADALADPCCFPAEPFGPLSDLVSAPKKVDLPLFAASRGE